MGMGGRGVVRVGLLGRSGSGSCANLLERRPGPGSGAIRAFATDLDKRRRHGPREGRPGPDGDRDGRPDRPGGPAGASVVVVTDHGADPAPEHFQ